MDELTRDVRHAWRGLRRDRAFAITTVATLAVALALVTAVRATVSLQNVSVLDAGAFAASAAIIGAAAGLATYYSARRAARLEPSQTLRSGGRFASRPGTSGARCGKIVAVVRQPEAPEAPEADEVMKPVKHSETMKRTFVPLTLGLLLAAGGSAQQPASPPSVEKRVIAPPGPKPVGPYSPGILAGDFLYVSGQGARDGDGKLPATVEGQVRQTLDNVKLIVEAAGLTMEHVVYCQVYLDTMAKYDPMDRLWKEYFPKAPPARSVLGVHRMPTDTPVEITAVAFRDLSRKKLIVPPAFPGSLSWTPGVMAGDRLYLSGFFGADPVTGKVADDPVVQVQLALDQMRQTLTAAGMDFRHVVFVNPYLTDKASSEMNAIYAKHFEFGNTPARATIRVSSLPGGNTIEFTGVAVADLSKRRAMRPKNMRPSATASPCVLADDTYYCSAKGPFTPGPEKVQGIYAATVEAQVRQTMRNLLDGLEEAGLGFSNVVATNVYLDNIDEFPKMNRVYAQYFPGMFPTRTTVAPVAPIDRKPSNEDTFPSLEQISLVAVR